MTERKWGVPGFRPYRPEPMFKLTSPTKLTHVDRKTLGIPIRDQLDEGACTGFGVGRAAQRALKMTDALSPQFLYFNGRLHPGLQLVDSGAFISDVVDAAIEYGISRESVYPYLTDNFTQRPTYEAYADAKHVEGKLKFRRLIGSVQVKTALAEKDTVVVGGFSVPEYFESQEMLDTGWLKLPGPNERFIGGHCVAYDGFDTRLLDDPEPFAWTANSWGNWSIFGGWFKTPLRWFDDKRRLCDEVYAVSPA